MIPGRHDGMAVIQRTRDITSTGALLDPTAFAVFGIMMYVRVSDLVFQIRLEVRFEVTC